MSCYESYEPKFCIFSPLNDRYQWCKFQKPLRGWVEWLSYFYMELPINQVDSMEFIEPVESSENYDIAFIHHKSSLTIIPQLTLIPF